MKRFLFLILGLFCFNVSAYDRVLNITIPATAAVTHFKTNNNYFCAPVENFNRTITMMFYNRAGTRSFVVMPTPGRTAFTVGNAEIEFAPSNRLCMLEIPGGSGSSHLWEWQIGTESPLPTTATLVTNFSLGDTNGQQCFLTYMHNNGYMAGGSSQDHMCGFFASLIQRFPSGVWTNCGIQQLTRWDQNCFPVLVWATESAVDGNLDVIESNDGGDNLNVNRLLITNGLFSIVSTGVCASIRYNPTNCTYVEWPQCDPITDWASKRTIVTFNNCDSVGVDVFHRATHINVTAFETNFVLGPGFPLDPTAYDVQILLRTQDPPVTNRINRLFEHPTTCLYGGKGVAGSNVFTLKWIHWDTNYDDDGIVSPILRQTISNNVALPLSLIDYTFQYTAVTTMFPYNGDYAYPDTNGVWHLIIDPPVNIYYTDPVAGSDANDGLSTTTAWKHLPGALNGTVTNILVDGDTLLVKGGTTNFSRVEIGTNYSGSNSYGSIIIQSGDLYSPAWGSGRAIIDGGTTNTAGFALGGGLSSGVLNGVTIDGFEVRNIAAGAAGTGYDNTSGSSCILAGGSVHPANWLTIKRCYLHDAARSIDNTGHGIEFAGTSTNFIVTENVIGPAIGTKGIEPYRASFGVISNNYISGTGDHCISINGTTNIDVNNNVIANNPPYVHEPQYGISIADGRNNDIYDNLIYRSVFPVTNTVAGRSGMGLGIYGISISNRINLNTIAFFNDPANSGAAQSAISQQKSATNQWTEYYNNLVFSNANAGGAIGFTADTASSLSNRMSFCDIFANNPTEQVMATETANVDTGFTVAAYNPTFGIFTNNQQLDPSFQAGVLPSGLDSNYKPNAGYFVLSHAAPIQVWKTGNTNTGDAVHGYSHAANKFAKDINGIPRTVWSMGAYELDQGNVVPFTNVSTIISGRVLIDGHVFIK